MITLFIAIGLAFAAPTEDLTKGCAGQFVPSLLDDREVSAEPIQQPALSIPVLERLARAIDDLAPVGDGTFAAENRRLNDLLVARFAPRVSQLTATGRKKFFRIVEKPVVQAMTPKDEPDVTFGVVGRRLRLEVDRGHARSLARRLTLAAALTEMTDLMIMARDHETVPPELKVMWFTSGLPNPVVARARYQFLRSAYDAEGLASLRRLARRAEAIDLRPLENLGVLTFHRHPGDFALNLNALTAAGPEAEGLFHAWLERESDLDFVGVVERALAMGEAAFVSDAPAAPAAPDRSGLVGGLLSVAERLRETARSRVQIPRFMDVLWRRVND